MTKEVKRYKRILHSLYIRLILVIVFCLGISVASFFTGRYIGNRYIDKVYTSKEMKTSREEERIEALRDYVSKNELSSNDTEKIAQCQNVSQDSRYTQAISLMEQGKYQDAIEIFTALGNYKDCISKIEQCNKEISYQNAVSLMKK